MAGTGTPLGPDDELVQWFTTRATSPASNITIVIDTAPSTGGGLENFLKFLGNDATYQEMPPELPPMAVLGELIARQVGMPMGQTLLPNPEQIQIVVSHSPLSLASLQSALQHAATAGAATYLVTHPHFTPLALIAWAGLDIFIRVERKVGDRIAHHAAVMTDRLFDKLHLTQTKIAAAQTLKEKVKLKAKVQKAKVLARVRTTN